jgi:hypothetical protein
LRKLNGCAAKVRSKDGQQEAKREKRIPLRATAARDRAQRAGIRKLFCDPIPAKRHN